MSTSLETSLSFCLGRSQAAASVTEWRTRTKSQVQRTKQLAAARLSCRARCPKDRCHRMTHAPGSVPQRHGAPRPRHCEAAKQPWQSSGTLAKREWLSAAEDCHGPAGLAKTERAEDCHGPADLAVTEEAEDCHGSRTRVIARNGPGLVPHGHGRPHTRVIARLRSSRGNLPRPSQ